MKLAMAVGNAITRLDSAYATPATSAKTVTIKCLVRQTVVNPRSHVQACATTTDFVTSKLDSAHARKASMERIVQAINALITAQGTGNATPLQDSVSAPRIISGSNVPSASVLCRVWNPRGSVTSRVVPVYARLGSLERTVHKPCAHPIVTAKESATHTQERASAKSLMWVMIAGSAPVRIRVQMPLKGSVGRMEAANV